MTRHLYPRTEQTLRRLAVAFTAGNVDAASLPLRLEHLSATLRMALEAEKAADGKPNDYAACLAAAVLLTDRMQAAGYE